MDINKDIDFVLLLEEMKKIQRRTKVIGTDRRENDAEHSWHIATMSMFLQNYSKLQIDINKVIKMLLIHDLVEIFAGDTFAYDTNGYEDKMQRETQAMNKLKAYLSQDMADLLETLWLEFEKGETNEAKYANAMDRLQPMLANIYSKDGGTWKENKVKFSQVLKRMQPIKNISTEIYDFIYQKIQEHIKKGNLIND